MPFYSKMMRFSRTRKIVLCAVGVYTLHVITVPPNPPPEPPCILVALDMAHRYIQTHGRQDD